MTYLLEEMGAQKPTINEFVLTSVFNSVSTLLMKFHAPEFVAPVFSTVMFYF